MTTPTQPTAGTGNATTNISGRESKGSQYSDKPQTPGEPAVADALVTVSTSAAEGNSALVLPVDLEAWEPGNDVDEDEQVREELDAARLTPGYDYEGDDVDLVQWEPGEDVDDDSLVAEELNAHRVLSRTPVDFASWFPGADAAVDTLVREELVALRLSIGSGSVNLRAWVAGADEAADSAVAAEVVAFRRQRRRNRNAGI